MWIRRLHQFLITPGDRDRLHIFWFSLSLTFAAIYGLLALQQAFQGDYIVQDDARQHVFWMQRFLDPDLFPHDLIADYFQSVAPAGYRAIYQLAAVVGMEPGRFSKLLPLVLGMITTGYAFGIALEILPVPIAGFITSLVLNQNLWLKDDLASATPRAFLCPLFVAFLYYLLRRSLLPCLVAIVLLALFYPAYVLIAAGLLVVQLGRWQNGKFVLSNNWKDYRFCVAGLAVSVVGLLPFLVTSSGFGPTMTMAEARTLPEFQPGGRNSFFRANPITFWLTARQSGLLPRSLLTPVTLIAGFFLPIVLHLSAQFPLAKKVNRGVWLLPQLLLVASGWFLVAHALLFKLHIPSRYTGYSFRLVIMLATGLALTLILDAVYRWALQSTQTIKASLLAIGTTLLIGITLIFYPSFVSKFPTPGYQQGTTPTLYQFFAQQPKNSLIASLTGEVNNLPTFARRPILVGKEYAIPYQVGYYHPFRQRMLDLIRAQYSPNTATVRAFIQQYGIAFWLLERTSFQSEYVSTNKWLKQYQPAADEAIATLEQGVPAIVQTIPRCKVFETGDYIVLKATCIFEEQGR